MPDQLNVLWIIADELRCDALSCYGTRHLDIQTPNIDKLAQQGILFEKFYTSSPVCVPARAALITCQSPFRTGILNNEVQLIDYPVKLDTWTEALGRNGWATMNFGKEHIPHNITPWQVNNIAGGGMKELFLLAQESGYPLERIPENGHVYLSAIPDDVAYPSEKVTENVLHQLSEVKQPFVIKASYLQPHTPYILPETWAKKYQHIDFTVDCAWQHAPNEFEAEFGKINHAYDLDHAVLNKIHQYYYGSVAWLDHQIGQIIDRLNQQDLAKNTVIIVSADHGAHLGEYGAFGKHTFASVSHRIPLIMVLPHQSHLAAIKRSDLVSSEDIGITLLNLLKVQDFNFAESDGRDLFSDPEPEQIYSVIGFGEPHSSAFPLLNRGHWKNQKSWPQRVCIRSRQFRYDRNTRLNGENVATSMQDACLIDYINDPDEKNNLIDHSEYHKLILDFENKMQRVIYDLEKISKPILNLTHIK